MRKQTAQARTHQFYEAYLRAQMRYLHKPTHVNWDRKEALLEAYQRVLKTKNSDLEIRPRGGKPYP